jgi:hypothetical protein
VNVPPGAKRGTYAAGLEVSTGTGTGGEQNAAGAESVMVFTVGIARPRWSSRQMAAAGNCWSPPGTYEPWQQWAATTYPTPPPGWHWEGAPVSAWAYTPPGGWEENGSTMRQVYLGGRPVVTCASAALWTRRDGKLNDSVPWIGGQYPDTSTPAGCAAWLAASNAGTLGSEPAVSGKSGPSGPSPSASLASSRTVASGSPSGGSGLLVVVAAVVVLLLLVGGSRSRGGARGGGR